MLGPSRVLRFRNLNSDGGPPAVLRERLEAFRTAFLRDPRPGLGFERGRLAFANEAAKRLLRSSAAVDGFLDALKVALGAGRPVSGLHLQTDAGKFLPELHPARSRMVHTTRICFLVKQPAMIPALGSLTERELSVLAWLVKGSTNGQIARRLGISIETVRKHIAHALKKTGKNTRTELVYLALRR